MSTDAKVTKDLMQTLEDGRKGFAEAADKLAEDDAAGPHANCRTDRQHKCQQQRFVDQGQYLTRHGRHDKLALVIIG